MIENIDGTIKLLKKLRAEGIGLALDDFGTGYSSLTYLIQLPIDTLKIDRSFVRNMTSGSDTETIVAAIISMAKQLNLKIIAEGVETEEQLSFLKKHGCDKFQGYLYSPPVSEDEFFKLL